MIPENPVKVFTLRRNQRSRWIGMGVHVRPESVFRLGRNMQESNGIDEVPDYTDPITFNAKISSPQVGQFVGLVCKLDALMISMDTLWLSSVLSNKQRVDGNYAWQQRIIKLARRIIDIEIRARKSAQAKGKEAEVEQAVPSTDDLT